MQRTWFSFVFVLRVVFRLVVAAILEGYVDGV